MTPTRSASTTFFLTRAAPAFDLLGLVVFVALGRREHDVDNGITGFATTLWPFAIAWFGVALATGLYRAPGGWRRAVLTWVIAVPIAISLRITFTDHDFVASFSIVALCVVGVLELGWRAAVAALSRRSDSSNVGA